MKIEVNENTFIRNVLPSDWEDIVRIEEENFSPEEAASPAALRQRLSLIADTFLVVEVENQLAGYVVGPAVANRHLTDDLFEQVVRNPPTGGYIAIQSLSISPAYKGQGLGTLLLAALKEIAKEQNRAGVSLTCHDYLISYYEMNGFNDEGESDSSHGGATWYDMVWENSDYKGADDAD
ncbi:GNAT family N-acetyltransferase [Streptococcus massiliensis]|nr:GNAT family N-acetyltransferase [Streptococcus massiliensis]